jgi:arylsulfatase A-like enzyme
VPLTPNLNMLAENGILLDNYYVQPSCSPSRACFMSGRYPLHTGINNWLPNVAVGLPLDEVTLADLLKENGYSVKAPPALTFKTKVSLPISGFECLLVATCVAWRFL